jgi:hypothetical protein
MALEMAEVTRDWIDDNRIVLFRLHAATASAINHWSETALQTLQDWPQDRPYLALHDLSQPGIGLLYMMAVQYDVFNIGITPDGRKCAASMIRARPDWLLSLALVVSYSLTGRMAKLRVFQTDTEDFHLQTKVFFNLRSAEEWLRRQR